MGRRKPGRGKRAKAKAEAPAEGPVRPARGAWACAAGVFAVLLTIYLLTAIPTVVDQDSGELVAAAHVLGIAHPTGYPLWTLLARGFDLLPVGHTSAYRVALLSAVSGAGAAALVCWVTMAVGGALLPGVFAGLAFGLWFPTWSQAVLAEVYALGALLFAVFLIALRRWDGERSPGNLGWVMAAGGLAAMHHRTMLLAAGPALGAALWLTRPREAKVWAKAGGAFAAPFLCYLYLPIRAAAGPAMNWGNPNTWDRFAAHVLGRQYSRWAFMNPPEVVMEQAGKLVGEALASGPLLSVLLALVGLPLIGWGFAVWYGRRPAAAGSVAAGCALLCVWVLEWGETSDLKVFLLPVGAAAALCGGLGLARASALLRERRGGRYAAAALGGAVCLALLFGNWGRADRGDEWVHRDRWAAALAQMEEDAILVAEWDNAMFATHYLQQVEGTRRDVTQVRPHGLWQEWYREGMADRELRGTAERIWGEVSSELDVTRPGTPEVWQGNALFAYRLAQHYRGRRTVYALHGPVMTLLPGPPYFVGLNENLYRLDFEAPRMVREDSSGPAAAEFPGGMQLVSLELAKGEAETGELVGFRARWRLESPLPGALFGIKLVPAGKGEPGWERRSEKGLFVQGFPVLYGLWGLPPSPAGTVYEQTGKMMVPSNAPEGPYRLEVGFAGSYPPRYEEWVEVEESLAVRRRALPRNEG